jgi:hypothetical protein
LNGEVQERKLPEMVIALRKIKLWRGQSSKRYRLLLNAEKLKVAIRITTRIKALKTMFFGGAFRKRFVLSNSHKKS